MPSDLPAAGQHSLPPDPKGTAAFIRRTGYRLEDALADIVDNCIDAGSSTVLIRLVRTKQELVRILIADDGRGMSEKKLDEIMQYGVQESHKKGDLGKYGIGLKSASFSQCGSLTVISRFHGETSGRRWTQASIAQNWTIEIVDSKSAGRFYNQNWGPLENERSGTVVVWDDLEIRLPSGIEFEKSISSILKQISNGLGLRFHRFIRKRKPKFFIDVETRPSGGLTSPFPIQLLDPFGYTKTGRKGFPTDFAVEVNGIGTLKLRAHIWPAKSKDPNYKLGGGNVAGRQGFYFYRNNRLIQDGGWNTYLKSDHEPHLSLARVEIDLAPELDSPFKLTMQKDAVEPPRAFHEALKDAYSGATSFDQYLKVADEAYRNASSDDESTFFVPNEGLPSDAAKKIGKRLGDVWEGSAEKVSFEWTNMSKASFFAVDREKRRIRLNKLYRNAVTGGTNSKTDAPLLKLLLFFLCEESLAKQRISGAQRERLDLLNDSVLDVIRSL